MKARDPVQFLFEAAESSVPLSLQQSLKVQSSIREIPNLARIRREKIASYRRMKLVSPEIEIPEEISLNVQNKNGDTVLIRAAYKDHPAIAHELIEAKADLNIQNIWGNTALIWAASKGHQAIAHDLIAAGANLNIQDIKGDSALIWAAYNDHPAIAHDLIEAGADLNIQSISGNTALIWAAYNDHPAIAHNLIEAGADLNIQNTLGSTALILAASKGHQAIAQELIEAGVKLELHTKQGDTALDIAIHYKALSIVSLLLSHGALVRHPQTLLDFLKTCDQQDHDVLVSLECLYKPLNARSVIKEIDAIEEKQSVALTLKPEIAQLYIKKLKGLHAANKEFYFLSGGNASFQFLPRPIIEIIMGYEDRRLVMPRSRTRIVFFEPATLDSPFQDSISEIREKTKKEPGLFDKVIEEINNSISPVKKSQPSSSSVSAPTMTPQREYKPDTGDKKLLGLGIGLSSAGLGAGIALVLTGLSLTGGWILLAACALILLACLLKAAVDYHKLKKAKAYEQQRLFPSLFASNVSSVPPPSTPQLRFAVS